MQTRSFTKSLLTAVALTSGIALGCVIGGGGDGGSNECPSGANNHELLDTCYCDAGFTWEDPNDPNNYNCVDDTAKPTTDCNQANNIEIGGQCYCDDGYEWCSDDPNDYSCCQQPGHDGAGTGADDNDTGADDLADTGTDTGADTGVDTGADTGNDTGVEPDPASCTADTEGFAFCSNTEAQGPSGSRYWVCMGGTWVEDTAAGDESCMFDGFDFAYGCVAVADSVQFICGDGPGTACEGDTATCVDMDVINYCLYGKLTEDSCMRICSEEGDDMGVTYDYGECAADTMECFCCDAGTENCPAE